MKAGFLRRGYRGGSGRQVGGQGVTKEPPNQAARLQDQELVEDWVAGASAGGISSLQDKVL